MHAAPDNEEDEKGLESNVFSIVNNAEKACLSGMKEANPYTEESE
jgi:hypothetical protein